MSNYSEHTQPLYGEATHTHAAYSPEVRAAFASKVFRLFAVALLITMLGVWLGMTLVTTYAFPVQAYYGLFIVELALIFTSAWWYKKLPLGYILFGLFAVVTGVALVPLLLIATAVANGPILIFKALGGTMGAFFAAGIYGWVTKKDLSSLGGLLFVGLIGILIAGIVNIFVGSSMMDFFLSAATVVVITGFVAYDIQNIKDRYPADMFLLAAIALYLDFFILFKNILMLLISMNRD